MSFTHDKSPGETEYTKSPVDNTKSEYWVTRIEIPVESDGISGRIELNFRSNQKMGQGHGDDDSRRNNARDAVIQAINNTDTHTTVTRQEAAWARHVHDLQQAFIAHGVIKSADYSL